MDEVLEFDLPAERRSAGKARRAVQAWLTSRDFPAARLDDWLVVLSELVTNAVVHGDTDVRVVARWDGDRVMLEVFDDSHGIPRVLAEPPAVGGRGLFLVQQMATAWGFEPSPDGKRVWARLDGLRADESVPTVQPRTIERHDGAVGDGERSGPGSGPAADTFELSGHPVSVDEVLGRVQGVLAVQTVAVLTPDSAGLHLHLTSARGLDALSQHPMRVSISSSFAGRIVTSRSPLEMQRQDPDADCAADAVLWQHGVQSLLGVPLLSGRRTIGVLCVGSKDARPFSDTEVLALQAAAVRVVTVLTDERSVSERTARTLQESLLPTELPRVDGLEFASRFVAAEDFGVGGDWFDVFPLPDRQIGVVIGDVAGSGLRAAVVMGRLRSALRAYAIESATPSEALTRLDRKFTHFEPNEMATILYLTVARDLQRITVSSTGHPPPVVAHPDGTPRLLECSPSAPIGAHVATTRVDVECTLHPGTTVVCYTDGLVERRREPLNVGLERLRNAVFAGPPDAVCAKIMTDMVGSHPVHDDTAMLAFRRTP